MNNENLRPLVAHSERAKTVASLGGIASGQARRERKALRETLSIILDNDFEVEGHTFDGRTALCFALVRRALNGDVRAFEAVRDQLGERPAERVEVAAEIDPSVRERVEAVLAGGFDE